MGEHGMMDWLTGRGTRREFNRFVREVSESLVRSGYIMTLAAAETEDLVQESATGSS